MTNLLAVLPDFNTRAYTHILPSLERAWVSTADLLTLDAIDVAKRAQVPAGEVKKLATAVLEGLQAATHEQRDTVGNGNAVGPPWRAVSTLDDYLDRRLGGGIPPGYVTEFVGERYERRVRQRREGSRLTILQRGGEDTVPSDPAALGAAAGAARARKVGIVHIDGSAPTDYTAYTNPGEPSEPRAACGSGEAVAKPRP